MSMFSSVAEMWHCLRPKRETDCCQFNSRRPPSFPDVLRRRPLDLLCKGLPDTVERDIWRIPASGGEAQRLTRHNVEVAYPTPTDSRTVFYIASGEGGSGPWLWSLFPVPRYGC
jgi:hypothetical protein